MKARIPIPKCYKEQINDYCQDKANEHLREIELDLVRRHSKFFLIALHKEGYGKARLERVMQRVVDLSAKRDKDEVFWKHIDDELIYDCNLNMPREDYEIMDY